MVSCLAHKQVDVIKVSVFRLNNMFLPSHWCFLVVHFLSGNVVRFGGGKKKLPFSFSSLFVFIAIKTCGFFLFQKYIFLMCETELQHFFHSFFVQKKTLFFTQLQKELLFLLKKKNYSVSRMTKNMTLFLSHFHRWKKKNWELRKILLAKLSFFLSVHQIASHKHQRENNLGQTQKMDHQKNQILDCPSGLPYFSLG